jgi:hypothetical protein
MRTFYLSRDEKANISMDFLTAIAVIVMAFLFAISVLSSMITPYSGYSKELYPTADRALTLLVEDEGYYLSDTYEGTDWEKFWYQENYSDIKKIGFRVNKENNTICSKKISSIMTPHDEENQTWWEYPTSSISNTELYNASQAMGFDRFNFYMQIRPIDENNFNVRLADQNARAIVGDKGDVVSVVRYSILNHHSFGDFDGAYLLGKTIPTKALFAVIYEDLYLIRNRGGLSFSITNWTIEEGKTGVIQNIQIDDETKKSGDSVITQDMLDGSEFNISINGVLFPIIPSSSTSIDLDVQNSNDKVNFFIPIETFNKIIPDWNVPGKILYVQINIKNLDVADQGIRWLNTTYYIESYPVKTTVWVW